MAGTGWGVDMSCSRLFTLLWSIVLVVDGGPRPPLCEMVGQSGASCYTQIWVELDICV